jgi:hypothetical protein
MVGRHARPVRAVPDLPVPDLPVPDLPATRQSLEDLRVLSRDLEVLVRAVPDLVALQAVLDAGLRPRGGERTVGATPIE